MFESCCRCALNGLFNYVIPQFRLGSDYRADFIVFAGQSNSYEITIVELKDQAQVCILRRVYYLKN